MFKRAWRGYDPTAVRKLVSVMLEEHRAKRVELELRVEELKKEKRKLIGEIGTNPGNGENSAI